MLLKDSARYQRDSQKEHSYLYCMLAYEDYAEMYVYALLINHDRLI